jgi:hypothetical protein
MGTAMALKKVEEKLTASYEAGLAESHRTGEEETQVEGTHVGIAA